MQHYFLTVEIVPRHLSVQNYKVFGLVHLRLYL